MTDDLPIDPPPGFVRVTSSGGFSTHNGPYFEKPAEGRVLRGFRALPRHANALGIVHGGMLAAFIDSTMGVAVHRLTGRRSVTLRLVTDFLSPGRIGEWIEAEAELTGSDEAVAHLRAALRGPRHLVMTGQGSFALLRSARPLRYPGRPTGEPGTPIEQG
jgi:acyl-coenzyme A thioesterase PaaI-like protein